MIIFNHLNVYCRAEHLDEILKINDEIPMH